MSHNFSSARSTFCVLISLAKKKKNLYHAKNGMDFQSTGVNKALILALVSTLSIWKQFE